ncbi:MAG: leucine-rich repeat protein, partial [Ruminococcus sp.]|nr:leucine-rich repeat protein [Ruminococcus sp.]
GYEPLVVDKNAYSGCTSIKEIKMPDNVQSIGERAFSGCTSLTLLTCGKNLLGLDKDSFNGCTALDTILFNKGLLCLGGGTFQNCTSLKEVKNIPTTIVDWVMTDKNSRKGYGLGDGVFSGCTALELCELPSSITRIPTNTFSGCTHLTTVVGDFNKNGDNIVIIDPNAFNRCTSLQKAEFKNVHTIDASAYTSCTSLVIADFPAAKYIGGNILGNNSTEKATINLDDKTFTGAGSTFSGCTSLVTVNIPSSEYILQNCFKGCTAMTTFNAGECEVVGNNALDGCSSIEEIKLISNLYGNAEPTSKNTSNGFVFQNCSAAKKITIKSGYMTKTPNGLFNGCSSLTTIDGDLTNIAIVSPRTFAGCTSLEAIDLPAVRILESNAFANCTSIKKISNSSNALNAEDYGDSAFLNCSELKIELGGEISTIGTNSFKGSGIQKVNIEGMQGGTVVIGNNAFSDCANLTEAKILSDSAAKFSIGTGVFANCSNLKTVTYDGKIVTSNMFKNCPLLEKIVTNATTIKDSAFEGDTALTMLEDLASPGSSIIADEINSAAFKGCASLNKFPADSHTNIIGSNNFMNCEALKSVEVGTLTSGIFSGCTGISDVKLVNISTIPSSAFAGCTSLEKIDFSNITSIGQKAFSGSGLTTVKVPNAQTIDLGAFENCASLSSAELSANTFGQNAFRNCTVLEKAVINVDTVGAYSFYGCTNLANVEFVSNDAHTLKEIGASAFAECNSLGTLTIEGDPKIVDKSIGFVGGKVNEKFTLVGKTGSTVQTYADNNKITFKDIDGYTPPVSKVTLLGDANCDKKVTVADSVAILQSIANKDKYSLSEVGAANADCCDPGNGITAKDALTIQRLDAKVITSLPEYTK